MMTGLVVKRGTEYLARKSKKARVDEAGFCWAEDIQKARVFMNHDAACRIARISGGVVRMMRGGRVAE